MRLGIEFDKRIDVKNPLDSSDHVPRGWDTGIDTDDYRSALFGFSEPLFISCAEWEKRELERIEKKI